MFNFFKKSPYNKKMPGEYKHLLNQAEFEAMVDIILQYFKEKGEPVIKVEGGYVTTKGEDGKDLPQQFGLDNLVRLVAAAPVADRESVIYTHFNRAYYDMRPLEYFKKDYEAAKQYLKILIKPLGILKQQGGKDVVHKVIFPGTCSVLVFDYDNKFAYLYLEMIKEWGQTVDALFDQALDNISREDISLMGLNIKSGEEEDDTDDNEEASVDVKDQDSFLLINPDFAAPAVCLLEQMAPFAIGKFGSIVAIPSKGYGIALPIKNAEVLKKISPLSIMALKLFNEQPGNITTSLYWYYNNSFQLFPETPSDKEGYVTVSLPQTLKQLLNIE